MLDAGDFIIKKSARARRVRITVKTDGTVVLTQPAFLSTETALKFARSKADWIQKTVAHYRRADILQIPKPSKRDHEKYKREAKLLVLEKLRIWSERYKTAHGISFRYGTVTIRNQSSRWGSCSKARNLNFTYRIVFLPEHLQDYLIVHELCHTVVFDHSRAFWALVQKEIPVTHIREFKKRAR
jgi:predicted metal-dependent hydrolase